MDSGFLELDLPMRCFLVDALGIETFVVHPSGPAAYAFSDKISLTSAGDFERSLDFERDLLLRFLRLDVLEIVSIIVYSAGLAASNLCDCDFVGVLERDLLLRFFGLDTLGLVSAIVYRGGPAVSGSPPDIISGTSAVGREALASFRVVEVRFLIGATPPPADRVLLPSCCDVWVPFDRRFMGEDEKNSRD